MIGISLSFGVHQVVNRLRSRKRSLEGLSSSNRLDERHLLVAELDDIGEAFVEQIDSVDQPHRVGITIIKTEEIHFAKRLVSTSVGASSPRVLALLLFIDARILAHIDKALEFRGVSMILDRAFPSPHRSMQSMTSLMNQQHIVNVFGHVLPHRKAEDPILNVEISRLDLAMLDGDILARQQLGKPRLGADRYSRDRH